MAVKGQREGDFGGAVIELAELAGEEHGLAFDHLAFEGDGVKSFRLQGSGDNFVSVGFGGVERIGHAGDLDETVGAGGVDAQRLVLLRVGNIVIKDLSDLVAGELDGDEELIEGAGTLKDIDNINLAFRNGQAAVGPAAI